MRRISLFSITFLLLSCSVPREIIKTPDAAPTCHCEGNGSVTLVLEAGMGNWSLFYQPIFQELKKDYKICLIDRPGYDSKIVPTHPRDAQNIAIELQELLSENNIVNNLILVGHSMGGLHVRMFQSLYPEQVEGIVLLDAAHPDQFDRLPQAFHNILEQQTISLNKTIKLAQKDYLKYGKKKIPTFGLPDSLLTRYYQVTTGPEYYCTMQAEIIGFKESLTQVEKLNDLGELPLLVIGSKNSMEPSILPSKSKDYPFEEHNEVWYELQQELSKLSSNSTFIGSSQNHYLHLTDNKLVTEQIKLFLNKTFKEQ